MARPPRKPRKHSGSLPFGELIAIFQPGVEHLVEENQRKRTDVVTPGDSAGGWDVDLDAKTATLKTSDDGAGAAGA